MIDLKEIIEQEANGVPAQVVIVQTPMGDLTFVVPDARKEAELWSLFYGERLPD